MMQNVKSALEDADVALLVADATTDPAKSENIFKKLKLKAPTVLVLNKMDKLSTKKFEELKADYEKHGNYKKVIGISALKGLNLDELLSTLLDLLPAGEPFYNEDDLSDLPAKFFVSEMVREKIYELFGDEIPYQTAVMINEYKEKETLTKIQADIIVQRESQKAILLGSGGKMIRQLGTSARQEIENFVQRKIFLELFVKVRPRWRDSDIHLKEYGY